MKHQDLKDLPKISHKIQAKAGNSSPPRHSVLDKTFQTGFSSCCRDSPRVSVVKWCLCSKEDQSLVKPSQVGIQQCLRCFRIFQTATWSWQVWQTCRQRTRTLLNWELEWRKALRAFQMTPGDTQKNSAFLRGAHDLPSMINSWHRGCATGNGTERWESSGK